MKSQAGRRLAVASAAALLFILACVPATRPEVPSGPSTFTDLQFAAAIASHKARMQQRYEAKDVSYVLSLLDYAITATYGGELDSARLGLTAAYKVEDGKLNEAAKFYQWLQVDGRTVYRMSKRERELIHLYLGLVYLYQDDLEESLVEFKKLRLRDQEASVLPAVNFYMGLVYEKLGKYDDALIEYRGLDTMRWVGSTRFSTSVPNFPGAGELVERVEQLKAHEYRPESGTVELVVHVDHQYFNSTGRTVVYADVPGGGWQQVMTMPPYVDVIAAQLTEAEAARKAAQEATARAAREGLRCCMTLLAQRYLGNDAGAAVADLAGDIAFGDERRNKDPRQWLYAPVAFSIARTRVPAGTREVKLEFHTRGGGRLGSCRYPLDGPQARAHRAADAYFVTAGLAPEFYVY